MICFHLFFYLIGKNEREYKILWLFLPKNLLKDKKVTIAFDKIYEYF